jgi:hypothetical protein
MFNDLMSKYVLCELILSSDFFAKRPFKLQFLWWYVCGVSTLLISLVEGSLFKSSLMSEVPLDCAENTANIGRNFISYPNVRDATLAYGSKKCPEYYLINTDIYKHCLFLKQLISIVGNFRTHFMLLTVKTKFTHLFL